MFSESTRETLTADINKAKVQGELLQNSADFLLHKLNELSQSDNELSSNEIKIIEKQLDYHKQMMLFKADFDIKKLLMRSKLKQSISGLINQMDGNSIIDTDLLDLECKLEQGLFNDSRDIIDDKLNNTDLSFEGLGDGFLNYKILGNFEKTNNVINYFTLELLENNILVDESRIKLDNQLVYSELSITELYKYIKNTIQLLLSKDLVFPDSIKIQHGTEFIEIDLLKIKNEIITEENLRLQEIEKQRLKEEKESNKLFLLGLLRSLLDNTINTEGREVLERKFNFTGNIDDGENEGYINLLNSYINEGYIDKQYILDLYDDNKISKIILLNFLEQDENFNYVEFIEEYGLTDKVKEIVLNYSREKLNIPNSVDDKILLENLTLFLLTFIMIESSGYNIKNRAGVSTADGFYQFLNANGKYNKDKKWLPGSFQTGLNRVKRFLSDNDFEDRFGKFNITENHENERNMKPSDLSAENQTILFFLDIVENGKAINSTMKKENGSIIKLKHYSDDMMTLILKEKNSWALGRIYKLLHHTDPDEETVEVYEREKNKYYYGDKKYIAKNHY